MVTIYFLLSKNVNIPVLYGLPTILFNKMYYTSLVEVLSRVSLISSKLF